MILLFSKINYVVIGEHTLIVLFSCFVVKLTQIKLVNVDNAFSLS